MFFFFNKSSQCSLPVKLPPNFAALKLLQVELEVGRLLVVIVDLVVGRCHRLAVVHQKVGQPFGLPVTGSAENAILVQT